MNPNQRMMHQMQQQAIQQAKQAHEHAAQLAKQAYQDMVRRFDQPGHAGGAGGAGGGGCIVVANVVALMVLAFIGLLAFYVLFVTHHG